MNTRFVEVTDGFAYGKFLVCRMDARELGMESAMPGAPVAQRLLTYGGQRRFHERTTLIVDVQAGSGYAWALEDGVIGMQHYLREHYEADMGPRFAWMVGPMYLSFVLWLHEQGTWAEGNGDIHDIPRYLELIS